MADSTTTERAERTVEGLATSAALRAVNHLTAPNAVLRADRDQVERMLREATRAPGRTVERAFGDIARTTINGATVDDLVMADTAALATTPSGVASPFDPSIDASAPLLAVVGRQVESPDRLTGITWPTDLLAVADENLADKGALPSGQVLVTPEDQTVATSGLVVDVSSWVAEVLSQTQRSSWIVDFLMAQTWRASEAWLAGQIGSQQIATVADLGAALDAVTAPHVARIIAGPASALLALDVLALDKLGFRLVVAPELDEVVVIAPSAADVTYSEPMALAIVEPERAGVAMSVSRRIA